MSSLDQLTETLAGLATTYDQGGKWPEASLQALASANAWRWIISAKYGGEGWTANQIMEGYEAVARGCLATLLILTQRDAACDLIETSSNESIKDELLPVLARGEILTTVGIAQITTSHQSGPPAMRALPDNSGYRLTGFMPWATAALKCQYIVTAAVLPGGRQLLAVLPTDAPGVRIDPPARLMALQHSWTSRVTCDDTPLGAGLVLAGPAERVLARRSPVKPMVVSTAGIGLAGALVEAIQSTTGAPSSALMSAVQPLFRQYADLRTTLLEATRHIGTGDSDIPSDRIRIGVNALVVRLAAAALTFAKGRGYSLGHPVERLVREAMFFLVWSAPDSIREGTLTELAVRAAT